jgi:hypothetical protein
VVHQFKRIVYGAVVCVLLLTVMLSTAREQTDTSYSSDEVKAAFLLSFLRYAEFPTNAFESTDSPLVIGVFENDEFGETLDQLSGYVCQGRPVTVQRFQKAEQASNCHLFFISNRGRTGQQEQGISKLKKHTTIIVCENPELLKAGATISLRPIKGRMRFDINLSAAKSVGITFSSRMLELANQIQE